MKHQNSLFVIQKEKDVSSKNGFTIKPVADGSESVIAYGVQKYSNFNVENEILSKISMTEIKLLVISNHKVKSIS